MNQKLISTLFYLAISGAIALWLSAELYIPVVYTWVFAVNVVLFLVFGKDKWFAEANWSRTPEATFLCLAFLGGFPALFTGRAVFNHKTSKQTFIIPMWIVFIAQIGLLAYYHQEVSDVFGFSDTDIAEQQQTPQQK